jgi:hypothetical protein
MRSSWCAVWRQSTTGEKKCFSIFLVLSPRRFVALEWKPRYRSGRLERHPIWPSRLIRSCFLCSVLRHLACMQGPGWSVAPGLRSERHCLRLACEGSR